MLGMLSALFATLTLLAAGSAPSTHFLVALSHGSSTGEPDPAFFIYAQALDPDFIAELDDILGLLDAEVCQFADMDEAVFAGQEFHKGAEVFDGYDLAAIDLADLSLGRHTGNGIPGNLHPFGGNGEDVHGAIIFDVDLATGFFDELLDVLAARADQRADLLGIDLDGLDARRVLA